MIRLQRVCLLFLAVVLASCTAKAVDPDEVYAGGYKSYQRVYGEWTREQRLYHNFDTELILSATMYSKVFRDALRGETVRAEGLPTDKAGRMAAEDEAEAKRVVRFFVNAYMPRAKWNNLDQKDPSFRLWLTDVDGRRVGPDSVRLIKLKRKADRLYQPDAHAWSKNYDVRFPASDEAGTPLRLSGGTVTLLATGVQGAVELKWDIP